MSDSIKIEVPGVQQLQGELDRMLQSLQKQKLFFKQAGMYMMRQVEGRLKNSGPNVEGEKYEPILAASYAGRFYHKGKKPPKWLKNIIAADGQEGRTSRAKGATAITRSVAQPLLTDRAAQTALDADDNSATIKPTRMIQKGNMAGLPVLLPHHPPSITRHAGGGIMPDRSSFFITDKDAEEILAIGRRQIDKEVAQLAARMNRGGAA